MISKVCGKCGIEKELDQYRNHKKGKLGKESDCRPCRNKYKMELLKKNLDYALRHKENNKKWRQKNSSYVKEKYDEWKAKNYTHMLKYFKDYNSKRTPEQRLLQRGNIIKKYWPGLTAIEALEKYSEMLIKQNYCCAICKKPETTFKKSLAIDHCHKTGKVRGALCYRCNRLYVNIHTKDTAKAVLEYLVKSDEDAA